MTETFTKIPDALIEWANDGRDKVNRRSLVMVLANLSRPMGSIWITATYREIMLKAGLTSLGWITKRMRELEALGFIEKEAINEGLQEEHRRNSKRNRLRLSSSTFVGGEGTVKGTQEEQPYAGAGDKSTLINNNISNNSSTPTKSKKSTPEEKLEYIEWLEYYKGEFYNATGAKVGWRFNEQAARSYRARIEARGEGAVQSVTKAFANDKWWNGTSEGTDGVPGVPMGILRPGNFEKMLQRVESGKVTKQGTPSHLPASKIISAEEKARLRKEHGNV
jgi:hypothetical protein